MTRKESEGYSRKDPKGGYPAEVAERPGQRGHAWPERREQEAGEHDCDLELPHAREDPGGEEGVENATSDATDCQPEIELVQMPRRRPAVGQLGVASQGDDEKASEVA